MAFDLAYNQKISRSITYACYRQRGNSHGAQNGANKTASPRNSHHAHKPTVTQSSYAWAGGICLAGKFFVTPSPSIRSLLGLDLKDRPAVKVVFYTAKILSGAGRELAPSRPRRE